MTPRERRERLFKSVRPTIRPIRQDDMRWLWAAWKVTGNEPMGQEEFYHFMARRLSEFDAVYMLEDGNRRFDSGFGPVGIVTAIREAGWAILPHVEWMPWARAYNKLRCSVAFLMKQRWGKEVGVIRIHADDEQERFFRKLKRYVPIFRAGHVPGGRPGGADHIFYVRGKKVA